jgi:hypothetical protein
MEMMGSNESRRNHKAEPSLLDPSDVRIPVIFDEKFTIKEYFNLNITGTYSL